MKRKRPKLNKPIGVSGGLYFDRQTPVACISSGCRLLDRVLYKQLIGYSCYRVGSDGSVWTNRKKVRASDGTGRFVFIQTKTWKRLKAKPDRRSRCRIELVSDLGKTVKWFVHVAVLTAFRGPRPSPAHVARHFPDRNPANNGVNNLLWGTGIENQADRLFHGTDMRGEKHPNAKLTAAKISRIRSIYAKGGWRQRDLANKFDIAQATLWGIIHRKGWKVVK